MRSVVIIIIIVPVIVFLTLPGRTSGLLHENHGSIKMGVRDKTCDDGETNIDWDLPHPIEYYKTCHAHPIPVNSCRPYKESCLDNSKMPDPIHHCMFTKINYTDIPPRGGPHRPIWPIYGEYHYIPVERWLHAMEHGAVVFLYDPCTDREEVEKVKNLVRSCIRKHIITPSEMLTYEYPMALLTWGCKLEFTRLHRNKSMSFIREKAMDPKRTNEYDLANDGHYSHGLFKKADVVSDYGDSNLCPNSGVDLDSF